MVVDVWGIIEGLTALGSPEACKWGPSVSAASGPRQVPARRVCAAQQAVERAKAGLAATKDTYIPDLGGFARYSYQSGIPFLVHNFGTFGVVFTYDLFDGGRRNAEIDQSRTMLSKAQLNLANWKPRRNGHSSPRLAAIRA